MTDPVRTAAIIELQNYIKKNVGKKQVMQKIADASTSNMMVKSENKKPLMSNEDFSKMAFDDNRH